MRKSWIGIIAVVTVLSAAGVGFAAFTSSVYVNAGASAGNVNLLFTGPSPTIPYVDSFSTNVATCSAVMASPSTGPSPYAYSTNTITFSTALFSPSDYCLFNNLADGGVAISNTGSLPATISESVMCSVNGGAYAPAGVGPGIFGASQSWTCGYFEYADTIYAGFTSPLPAGGTGGFAAVVYLPTGTGNAAQGQNVEFQVTITGTDGT